MKASLKRRRVYPKAPPIPKENGVCQILCQDYKTKASVSEEDYELLVKIKWTLNNGHLLGSYQSRPAFMHAIVAERVLGPRTPKHDTDHIDRNPLNNQRENLRYITRSQNILNSNRSDMRTKPLGITFAKGKWVAQPCTNGTQVYLGRFDTALEAEIAVATYLYEKGVLK